MSVGEGVGRRARLLLLATLGLSLVLAIWLMSGSGGVSALKAGARTAQLHCQTNVDAVLKTRTIRFAEASVSIDPASAALLDEVAAALRPCTGSIVAITGHTDASGDLAANTALSLARAEAVRDALAKRGLTGAAMRARGAGPTSPVEGLDAADPANRRIEFSVLAPARIMPTPVDTPIVQVDPG